MAKEIIAKYKPKTVEDMQNALKDIFGPMFEAMLTDRVLEELNEWQNRPLKKVYPFVFVDCMYVTIRKDYEVKETAVYTILGYDLQGKKDILGLWLNEMESKNVWMQIFDEIKKRGVEEIFFISMDGVSGLSDGAKSIFPNVIVQRCIVHLIRNSIKYIPSKDYKAFTSHLKKIYGAPSLKVAENEFEKFRQTWSMYPGAVDVWVRNFEYGAQLFDYGSAIRKVMYTTNTNAVESIHSSFRKVTKQGAFPNENALLKLLYLRITELYAKWNGSSVLNWAMVRNQLAVNSKFQLLSQHFFIKGHKKRNIKRKKSVMINLSQLKKGFFLNFY